MKKGLNVSLGLNVNLENVRVWAVGDDFIELGFGGQESLMICIEGTVYPGEMDSHPVSVNEFKRIEREIEGYMNC